MAVNVLCNWSALSRAAASNSALRRFSASVPRSAASLASRPISRWLFTASTTILAAGAGGVEGGTDSFGRLRRRRGLAVELLPEERRDGEMELRSRLALIPPPRPLQQGLDLASALRNPAKQRTARDRIKFRSRTRAGRKT